MATWIFQGNPSRFDVDLYLAGHSELIRWKTPTHQREIRRGDRAFVWRAGRRGGAVGAGFVVEEPTPDPDAVRTGIQLLEVRLTEEERFLPRSVVKADPALAGSSIIRAPQGTVFRLDSEQAQAIERLWVTYGTGASAGASFGVTEGELRLAAHRRRERSALLRDRKLAEVRNTRGFCVCEICGLAEGEGAYPSKIAGRVFEVHHLVPLANAATPAITTLADLAILCANCHRAVHASKDVGATTPNLPSTFGVLVLVERRTTRDLRPFPQAPRSGLNSMKEPNCFV